MVLPPWNKSPRVTNMLLGLDERGPIEDITRYRFWTWTVSSLIEQLDDTDHIPHG